MTSQTFNFTTGMDAAEEAAARTSFHRTGFFGLKDGESAILRFVTEHTGLITVKQHGSAPTRNAPDGYSGKWPQSMPAVCRNNAAFRGAFEDCYLCLKFEETGDKKYKATDRSYALAAIRKQRMVEGRAQGIEDEMEEFEKDGTKVKVPKIVLLNFWYGNFWGNLATIQEVSGDTWLACDIRVTKKGDQLDAVWSFANYPPCNLEGRTPKDGDEILDLRNPEHYKRYAEAIPDIEPTLAGVQGYLGKIVAERASDDFYDRFFDVRHPQPKNTTTSDAGGSSEKVKPQDEPSDEEMAALAARIQGHPTEPAAESSEALSLGD